MPTGDNSTTCEREEEPSKPDPPPAPEPEAFEQLEVEIIRVPENELIAFDRPKRPIPPPDGYEDLPL